MRFFDDLRRDAGYAVRALRREPMFVMGVVTTFALAIGTNAAMVGLVQRLMFAPPPGISDADRVARVGLTYVGPDGDSYGGTTTSYPVFRALAESKDAFSSVAAERVDSVLVGRGGDAHEASVIEATGGYFATLGAVPQAGHFFGEADDVLPSGNAVVVLGHAYWQRHFGGNAAALGAQLAMDGTVYTVIGIAAPGFNGDELAAIDLYIPLSAAMRSRAAGWWIQRGLNLVSVVTRRRQGVSAALATTMATGVLGRAAGDGDRVTHVELQSAVPGAAVRGTGQSRIALWLSGVSVIVLLIATANVGTLLLLRAARRRREMAVRIALGAARGRLTQMVLVESVLLALAGAAAGLMVSHWFEQIVRATLLPDLAGSPSLIDSRMLWASVTSALVAGLLAGIAPSAQLGRRRLSSDLKAGGHGASRGLQLQNVLVGVQMALCTVLLVGAGLFVSSLRRVQSQDLGFSTAHLLYVTLDFQGPVPASDRDAAHVDAARRLESMGGVERTSIVESIPFGPHNVPPINIPGMAKPLGAGEQLPFMYGATPASLAMLGVKVVAGRGITDGDGRGTPLVVLVNETLARKAWPGQSALGKCVRAGFGADMTEDPMVVVAFLPCRQVVGVVRDSRARSLRTEGGEGAQMQYYVPFGQVPSPPVPDIANVSGILVQTAGSPERLAADVQRAVQASSARPVYARVQPYQTLIDPQLRSWRLGATLFSMFGVLAMGIAAVGLFGVISYLVSQRTQEIGVRLALGGTGAGVAELVVTDAVKVAGAGIVVGTGAALLAAPAVQSMLFGVGARDPAVVGGAGLVLLGVTVAAAAWPAWRAGRVSPTVALRADG